MLNKSKNVSGTLSQEAEVLLLGYMARVFGTKLMDVLDKKMSFEKASFRLLELVLAYFNTTNMSIRRACAKTWIDVYAGFKNSEDSKKYFFIIEPLVALIKGGAMVASQQTAAQVLLDTVRVAKEEGDENFIELAADDCFQLFLVSHHLI